MQADIESFQQVTSAATRNLVDHGDHAAGDLACQPLKRSFLACATLQASPGELQAMIRQVSDLYSQTEATAREQEENGLLDEQGENFKVWSWQLAYPNGLWCPQAVCAEQAPAGRRAEYLLQCQHKHAGPLHGCACNSVTCISLAPSGMSSKLSSAGMDSRDWRGPVCHGCT